MALMCLLITSTNGVVQKVEQKSMEPGISRGVFLNIVCAELVGIALIPKTKISISRQT
jgi:hypothetical protein